MRIQVSQSGAGRHLLQPGGRTPTLCFRLGLAALCLLISLPVSAYQLPKWEIGLGAGVLRMPAYRGALGRENTWLPVPYLAYRGGRFKVDEEGMRGTLLHRERFHLDFSVAGSLPVSEGDGIRKGMSRLDPIGEIGPSLDIALGQVGDRHVEWEQEWWLRLPFRAALSVGDPLVGYRGFGSEERRVGEECRDGAGGGVYYRGMRKSEGQRSSAANTVG
mgnify:CR=1 FL=1